MPINVKTAEPIRPKFFVAPPFIPGIIRTNKFKPS